MVHCLAVPHTEERGLGRLMAVARGDGCVSVYDADCKQPAVASSSGGGSSGSGSGKKSKAWAGGKRGGVGARQQAAAAAAAGPPGRLALLGQEQGGHSAAVNCVAFRTSGIQLLSAGNDCRLLLWNWGAAQEQQAAATEARAEQAEQAEVSGQLGGSGGLRQGGGQQAGGAGVGEQQLSLAAEHRHARKINWACTADVPGCSYDVFLADTGRRLTALSLAP